MFFVEKNAARQAAIIPVERDFVVEVTQPFPISLRA
jgi:hypothetical protein